MSTSECHQAFSRCWFASLYPNGFLEKNHLHYRSHLAFLKVAGIGALHCTCFCEDCVVFSEGESGGETRVGAVRLVSLLFVGFTFFLLWLVGMLLCCDCFQHTVPLGFGMLL